MTEAKKTWTGHIQLGSKIDISVILNQLCQAFNSSPFFKHNAMTMRVVNDEIEAHIEMLPNLIGNVAFQILHGGVAATMLDSIGGIVAMGELYKQTEAENMAETIKKVSRLALKSVLSEKVSDDKLVVVDTLKFDAPKTKEFAELLNKLDVSTKTLVVLEDDNEKAVLSARNLENVKVVSAQGINTLDVADHDKVVITKAALSQVEEVLA